MARGSLASGTGRSKSPCRWRVFSVDLAAPPGVISTDAVEGRYLLEM
jgi:hypothetical protein